jgi:type I restriction enzyme M protein
MLAFDRSVFDKTISLAIMQKTGLESGYESVLLGNIADFQSGLWKGEKGNLQKVGEIQSLHRQLGETSGQKEALLKRYLH